MSLLLNALIFLVAAVVLVPVFKRLGLGEVLGYLAAGVLIGPSMLALVPAPEDVLQFAQVGIVFLLFVIGLELKPSRLKAMRKPVFGFGGLQVLVTTVALAGLAWILGLAPMAAIIVGFSLALCSTPLVLQLLAERRELSMRHGRKAFALLLFQDLAAIPAIAIIPILAVGSLLTEQPGRLALEVLTAVGAFVALIVGGHYLLRPLFRLAAGAGSREVFAGAALTVVIGSALLMDVAGLSMALGAFIAGVLLADSEYRHTIEADIEPFRGLLLGLFFMAVGMAAQVGLLLEVPLTILGLTAGLVIIKALTILLAARLYGLPWREATDLGVLLAQGGEFGFVLLTAAVGAQVLEQPLVDRLILVVSLSMAATPVLFLLSARWLRPRFGKPATARPFDVPEERSPKVVVVGFGRFGQIVGRVLRGLTIPYTVLDINPEQVDFVRRYGNPAYYGDAGRSDILQAAGTGDARVLVLCIGDVEASMRVAELVRRDYPGLRILARAHDRHHAHLLMRAGVHRLVREMFFSSLALTRDLLIDLGLSRSEAERAVETFRRHDEATLRSQLAVFGDEHQIMQTTQEAADELQTLYQADAETRGK
ncbi:monovalent cation:proton antiporter-2 (CPA2) family protein [Aquisalimonas sp.]|uniref:monovalent cation:proton antiporter-2 (CPA2) family protein n=1 Tax=Aquisalimonas sp. TaxID=1872621 RepID=UPI0025C6BD9A|nr:monovalent cation:proton antiporter-2 (CPA2) family protein [Aquisalimonas sp.]